jgi:hypothetical protein
MDNPPGAWITCGQSIDNENHVANTLPTRYPHPLNQRVTHKLHRYDDGLLLYY